LKILFIGGTGVISSSCAQLCVDKGYELLLLNRGKSFRAQPKGAETIKADIKDLNFIKSVVKDQYFDVVVNWIAYTPDDVKNDYEIFRERTSQYIFISSASCYAKPPILPICETHTLENPFWKYSANKILCEKYLIDASIKYGFPVTIVRPSHTYDHTIIPLYGGYTALNRLTIGKKIIIHGDGTSLWTLTHHRDFAKGFVELLGKSETIGEAYHITGDEVLTWDQICYILADAVGVEPNVMHIPSDFIKNYDEEWTYGLFGDKSYSMVFDNSKIKKIAPHFKAQISFVDGAKEIVEYYLSDETRQVINLELNEKMDMMISGFESILNN
jgi:nucleoside-diphosphate-sugar epimerase